MKFTITETVPCVQIWTYEVEAENETEALKIILQGDTDAVETLVDEHVYEQTQYEIEDENGDVYDVEVNKDDDGPEYDSAGFTDEDRVVDGQYRVIDADMEAQDYDVFGNNKI